MYRSIAGAFAAAALLTVEPAQAHHSFAMFDQTKTVVLVGAVKEFQWVNPHTWVQLLVKDPQTGAVVEWSIEGTPTPGLKRRGWTRLSLQPGDVATIEIHPLKTGGPGGSLLRASVNGKVIGNEDQ